MRSRIAALPALLRERAAARRRARVPVTRPDGSPALRIPKWCWILILTAGMSDRPLLAQNTFSVDSPDLRANAPVPQAQVYKGDGCSGGNRSPELHWHNPPVGTKAFAVTVFDIDAPGPGWWHWAVTNLPATLDRLPEDASASGFIKQAGGIEARNDYDDDGYDGPCPPPGKPHRYVITVYALSGLDAHLAQGRPAPMFDHEINLDALAQARLTVTYQR